MVLKSAVAYDAEALDAIFLFIERIQKETDILIDNSEAHPMLGLRGRSVRDLTDRLIEATSDVLDAVLHSPHHVAHLHANFLDEPIEVSNA